MKPNPKGKKKPTSRKPATRSRAPMKKAKPIQRRRTKAMMIAPVMSVITTSDTINAARGVPSPQKNRILFFATAATFESKPKKA